MRQGELFDVRRFDRRATLEEAQECLRQYYAADTEWRAARALCEKVKGKPGVARLRNLERLAAAKRSALWDQVRSYKVLGLI